MKHIYVNGKFLSQKISGVQRYASQLLQHCYELDKEITIVAPESRTEEGAFNLQIPVVTTGARAGLWWEQAQLPLFVSKQQHPLLLNLCNMAPVFYGNKISCIHDIAFLRYPHFFSKPFYYYYKALIPAIIKTSRHIITVSEFSKTELISYYKLHDDQITVVPNAGFTAAPIQDKRVPPLHKPYFLFVGSADPRKNLLFLLKAYTAAQLQDTDLVVAGSGYASFNNALLKETMAFTANPRIHFLGHITDQELSDYYHFAKAVIVPSVYEGFGLPIAEALSAASIVLAADIPVFREVAGEHAFYFNPYKTGDLIALLKEMDRAPKKNNEAGLRHIHRQYSWKNSANALLERISEWR